MAESDSFPAAPLSKNHERDYSDDDEIVPAKRAKKDGFNEDKPEDCSRITAVPACADKDKAEEIETWEAPFLEKLGTIASSKGGRVLEIGFGGGISAKKIQEHDVEEHVIVEKDNYERLEKWAKDQKHKVTALKGVWQDTLIDLDDESFDGILYNGFAEQKSGLHSHQFDFISEQGFRLLKSGGVLTYANLPSWGEYLNTDKYDDAQDMFQETQVVKLVEIGFKEDKIKTDVVAVEPPEECTYYTHHEIVAATLNK